ncbi:hypothetical protein NX059_012328 [Plenodomus lindquistii]|nr:hypothetical protein NX059_012328 [Plenodomus lindquistii]
MELQTDDFGSPTTTAVLLQDAVDVNVTPELPNPDAQHTDLQSRYATLQQEYKNSSMQHETLVRKCDTQHEKIDHLENMNAEIKDLLEKHKAEQQQLNDAYYCVKQEHEICREIKEQLQDLAQQWKAQSKEIMELHSTCTKLRQEFKKAGKSQSPEEILPRIEEAQAPLVVEARLSRT